MLTSKYLYILETNGCNNLMKTIIDGQFVVAQLFIQFINVRVCEIADIVLYKCKITLKYTASTLQLGEELIYSYTSLRVSVVNSCFRGSLKTFFFSGGAWEYSDRVIRIRIERILLSYFYNNSVANKNNNIEMNLISFKT